MEEKERIMVEFQGKFDSNVTNTLNNRQFKKVWWLFVISSILFVGIGVAAVLMPEDNSDKVYGIVMIVFGVMFTPLVILLTKLLQKNVNKSMHILSGDTTETYQFYPDKLIIRQCKGEEFEAITTTRYSYLYMVEETRYTYFLRISKMQSHVVNKADLTQGTIEELNAILSSNLGLRFKSSR